MQYYYGFYDPADQMKPNQYWASRIADTEKNDCPRDDGTLRRVYCITPGASISISQNPLKSISINQNQSASISLGSMKIDVGVL